MPPKDVKRQSSELPTVSPDRSAADPNVIPSDDLATLASLGMSVGKRLKRGRYGVVYEATFTNAFSMTKLIEAAAESGKSEPAVGGQTKKKPLLHYLFVRPEQKRGSGLQDDTTSSISVNLPSETANLESTSGSFDMQPGRKFALKYVDIELRKAYHIEDVEQRLRQELNFVRRVTYNPTSSSPWSIPAVVRHLASLATHPSRYYLLMELAEDNLQCLINAYVAANQLLPPKMVLSMYACLVATIRSLHQQKLTYGMMRTSNILVFGQAAPTASLSPVKEMEKVVGKGGEVVGSSKVTLGVIKKGQTPFHLKIADFVASVDMTAKGVSPGSIDQAVEEDLDDLYYVHAELFTLTKLDFAQYQAFKESLKLLTDITAHRNSIATLDKVLEMVNKFALEQKEQ